MRGLAAEQLKVQAMIKYLTDPCKGCPPRLHCGVIRKWWKAREHNTYLDPSRNCWYWFMDSERELEIWLSGHGSSPLDQKTTQIVLVKIVCVMYTRNPTIRLWHVWEFKITLRKHADLDLLPVTKLECELVSTFTQAKYSSPCHSESKTRIKKCAIAKCHIAEYSFKMGCVSYPKQPCMAWTIQSCWNYLRMNCMLSECTHNFSHRGYFWYGECNPSLKQSNLTVGQRIEHKITDVE